MKPEKDTPESEASEAEEPIHPLEVMRPAYGAMEIAFQEDGDTIFTRQPVRAAPEFRAQAGEFLHRLNEPGKKCPHRDSKRKLTSHRIPNLPRLLPQVSPFWAALGLGCTVCLPASGPFGRIWRSSFVGASQRLHSQPAPAGTCPH